MSRPGIAPPEGNSEAVTSATPSGSLFDARRDRLVGGLCNWLLNNVASSWYRDMIGGSIQSGLRAAVEEPKLRAKLAKASKWNRYHQQKCANLRWQVSCDQLYIDALEKHVGAASITEIREQMKVARRREAR